MRRKSNPRITLIEELLAQPRQLIVTILIGNEFVNVAASVISAAMVIHFFGSDSKWINLLIMVPILLLVGEITPKTLAIRNNMAFATFQSRPIDLFAKGITPLRWVVRGISDFFITLIVGKERSRANILTEDMVRSLTAEAVGDGALDRREALYINRIFDFGDRLLRDILTPRSQILFLPANATFEEAARHYVRSGHTKIPIYDKRRDNIIGVLYTRDLLGEGLEEEGNNGAATWEQKRSLRDIVRPAYFVPESKTASELFYSFQKRKISLALTLDEYGGVTGLVTMEDVLECVFGEILSPSEKKELERISCEMIGDGLYRIDGTMTLWQFRKLFPSDADFEDESVETVAGLLLQAFGELPEPGSRMALNGFEFTVESIKEQRIASLTVASELPPQVAVAALEKETDQEADRGADRGADKGAETEAATPSTSAVPEERREG
jgi:CBS domain containing-hemolysin-like protein